MRLVAVWSAKLGRHRLYLTSAPRNALPLDAIASTYTLRWEIELLFRELKRQLRIEDIPTGNKAISECLIYAALLALALGRSLHTKLTTDLTWPARRSPPERWTSLLRALAPMLLELLLGARDRRLAMERRLLGVLRREAPDPNRRRLLLPDRAHTSPAALAA